ncbi:MAG: IS1634 family transposase [Bacteroidetes bacterium]|nr:IS1634 family transposase [Bacteroidota bacterium]
MSLVYAKNKKNQTIYVYESEGYWDKEKQQSRNKKTCIGKMVEGEFVPNKHYQMRQELQELKEVPPGRVRATEFSRLFHGATYLFDQIGDRYGITEDLVACFPETYTQILSLAYYLILEDRNPLSRFGKWAQTHVHPHGQHISSQRSSEFFRTISEDAKQRFFMLQVARRKEHEYLAYDTTSVSSYSKSLKQVKYGRNKDHDPLAQINLALLCGHDSRMPVYYRKLPGNISDVSTLRKMLSDIDVLQVDKVKMVMDRGFYSEDNLHAFYKNHYKFLIGAKSSLKFIQKHLDPVRETIRTRAYYHSTYQLGCYTVMTNWPYKKVKKRSGEVVLSEKRIYVHLYYNEQQAVEDKIAFNKRLDLLEEELYSEKRIPAHEKLYSKYYEIQKTPVRGMQLTPRQESLDAAQKNFGYFALLSNGIKDPIEALEVYRSKDLIEKAFGNLKERLNMRRTSVSSEQNLEGKLFVQFVALMYLSSIDKTMKEQNLYKKYTLNDLLDTFDVIEQFQSPGHTPHVGEVTQKQKELYGCFGVDAPT